MAELSRAKFLSQAEFARARGVSRKTVTGWKKKGLLSLDAEERVDVEATEWNLDQRPATYRGGVTHRPVRGRDGNNASHADAAPKPAPKPFAGTLSGPAGTATQGGFRSRPAPPKADGSRSASGCANERRHSIRARTAQAHPGISFRLQCAH